MFIIYTREFYKLSLDKFRLPYEYELVVTKLVCNKCY